MSDVSRWIILRENLMELDQAERLDMRRTRHRLKVRPHWPLQFFMLDTHTHTRRIDAMSLC